MVGCGEKNDEMLASTCNTGAGVRNTPETHNTGHRIASVRKPPTRHKPSSIRKVLTGCYLLINSNVT